MPASAGAVVSSSGVCPCLHSVHPCPALHPRLLPGPHHGFLTPVQSCSYPSSPALLHRAARKLSAQVRWQLLRAGGPASLSSLARLRPWSPLPVPAVAAFGLLSAFPASSVWNRPASACPSGLTLPDGLCAAVPTMLCHEFLPVTQVPGSSLCLLAGWSLHLMPAPWRGPVTWRGASKLVMENERVNLLLESSLWQELNRGWGRQHDS